MQLYLAHTLVLHHAISECYILRPQSCHFAPNQTHMRCILFMSSHAGAMLALQNSISVQQFCNHWAYVSGPASRWEAWCRIISIGWRDCGVRILGACVPGRYHQEQDSSRQLHKSWVQGRPWLCCQGGHPSQRPNISNDSPCINSTSTILSDWHWARRAHIPVNVLFAIDQWATTKASRFLG